MTISEAILYVILGLGPGAVYGALGLGLVITYRGSGIINLAYGAMAMYPAYVYAELSTSGDLVLAGIPGSLHIADQVDPLAAVGIALIVAGLLGLAVYTLVVRPLLRAPPLATVVAAVGVMIVLQAVVVLRFGTDPRFVDPLLPARSARVGAMSVPLDRLYLVALLGVAAVASLFIYRRTRFGLASRGAAESEQAAELLGYSTVRLGGTNWVIGAVLAALFGILLAPIAGLSPGGYSLLVVPALVAALAGRLVSTIVTIAAGLTLGVLQSVATAIRLPWEWLGPQTLRTIIPFLALLGVLMARGTPLPPRGAGPVLRLPAAPATSSPWRGAALILIVGAAATFLANGGYRSALIVSMIGAILCLSLVILTGFAGQVSLAQMSFAGIGGFVLSGAVTSWQVPFPVAPLLAAIVAGASGLAVGIPAGRARGMTLAIMTLGGALVVEELIFRNLSNGILSTNPVAPARVFGVDLAATSASGTPRVAFGLVVVAVLVLVALGVMHLRSSGAGRRLLAVRSNERAAAATGINVARTKLIAFGLSGFVAGLAGALAGYHQGALSDQSFGVSRSLVVLAVAYLGGIGTVAGALLGGLVIPGGVVATLADRVLDLGRFETLFAGVAVVAVALRNPEGIASTIVRLGARARRLRRNPAAP